MRHNINNMASNDFYFIMRLFVFIYLVVEVQPKEVKITVTSINCAYDCSKCRSQIFINRENHSPGDNGINMAVLNPLTAQVSLSASFVNTRSSKFTDFITNIKDGYVVIATSQLLCGEEITTNFRKQKAILYGFEKLGMVPKIPPVLFRSGVYIFCKNKCSESFKANMKLPVAKFKETNEDPIMISFAMETVECKNGRVGCVTSNDGKTVESKTPVPSNSTTLLKKTSDNDGKKSGLVIAAVLLPLLLAAFTATAVYIYVRRKRQRKRNNDLEPAPRRELNSTALRFCEDRKTTRLARTCSDTQTLISRNERNSSPEEESVKHAKSLRLFQKHRCATETPATEDDKLNFATYVEVCTSPTDDPSLYKVPTSIRRHAPPSHLPPFQESSEASCVRPLSDAYLDMTHHDYESLDDVGFISTSGERTEGETEEECPVFVDDQFNTTFAVLNSFNRAKSLYERCSTSMMKNSASDYDYGSNMDPSP